MACWNDQKTAGGVCCKPIEQLASLLDISCGVQHDLLVDVTKRIDLSLVHQVVENDRHNVLHAVQESLAMNSQP